MTTVPRVTRFDDFRLALWDLTAGTKTMISPASVLDLQFETAPGVDGDRLKSATFEIPWYENARNEIDFDNLQLVQIDRYSDADWTLWGILLKPSEGYSGRQKRDTIKIQVAQIEEFLRSRKVYKNTAGTIGAVSDTAVYADDFAKTLVTACFSGTDIDSVSREWEWGTLVVEADASECDDTHDFTALSGHDDNDTLLKHVDDLSRTYDFDYQIVVSVTGGAFTFTFKTKAPYGGEDLTTGANRVMIKDLLGMVPAARRYRDAAFRATVMHVGGYQDTSTDADGLATWGRWEGLTQGAEESDAEQALERAKVAQGAEYEFESTGANGMTRWLEHFRAGDYVLRTNNRLGIAADSEQIAAVIGRFENKVLRLKIRWGEREPGANDRGQGGSKAPNKGPEARIPVDAEPVATASTGGTDPYSLVYGDHQHALQVTADDSNVADIDAAGVLNVLGAGGIATSVVDGDLTIDGSGLGDCYWQRSGTTLFQATLGDDVQIQTGGGTPVALIEADDGTSHWAGPLYIGSASTEPAQQLHLYDGGGEVWTRWEGGITSEMGVDSGGIATWQTLSDVSLSVRPNQTETLHINSSALYITNDRKLIMNSAAVGSGAYSFYVDPTASPPTAFFEVGMYMIWEGVAYRMPTDAPAAGEVLAVASTAPNLLEWSSGFAPAAHNLLSATHGDTVVGSGAAGDLIYYSSGWRKLARGSATTDVLRSAGLFTAPYWDAPSSDPGTTANKLLMTGASGALTLNTLNITTSVLPVSSLTPSLGSAAKVWLKVFTQTVETDYINDLSGGGIGITSNLSITGNITITGTVDGVDISAFKSAYDAHTHALTGHTDTYVFDGAKTFGTYLYNASMQKLFLQADGTISTSAGTEIGTGVQPHYHNLTGGTYGTGAMNAP